MADPTNETVIGRLMQLSGQVEGLKGSVDGLRFGLTILGGAVALLAALMTAGFTFFGFQIAQVSSKLDTIPAHLAEEFRAMRAEIAAQTSAIANSITATRQIQPQLVPMPQVGPPPPSPMPTLDNPVQQLFTAPAIVLPDGTSVGASMNIPLNFTLIFIPDQNKRQCVRPSKGWVFSKAEVTSATQKGVTIPKPTDLRIDETPEAICITLTGAWSRDKTEIKVYAMIEPSGKTP